MDPGGSGVHYLNNTQGNVDIPSVSGQIGIFFSFNPSDFGISIGDTLWFSMVDYPACRTNYFYRYTNIFSAPASFIINNVTGVKILFRSNADNFNDRGFDITWKRLYKKITTVIPNNIAGNAFYYNPDNGGLQVGQINNNTGANAAAIGDHVSASGTVSTAIGGYTSASGYGSLAGGYYSIASGPSTLAFGTQDTASGNNSIALGYQSKASGIYSAAINYQAQAQGIYSFASGYNSIASNYASMAGGYQSVASGSGSVAFGFRNTASGDGSACMGGVDNLASGSGSFAVGEGDTAIGQNSFAANIGNKAIGAFSAAIGASTVSKGYASFSTGYITSATGESSFASGFWNFSKCYAGAVIGAYNDSANVGSPTVNTGLNRLFQIGNGTANNQRSNALTVLQNGNIGIGELTPSAHLHISGSGLTNQLILEDTLNNKILKMSNDGTVAGPYIGTSTFHPFSFFTNGLQRAVITSTGNIGIGNTAPLEKLEVAGNTKAQNLYATTGLFADLDNLNSGTTANALRFGSLTSGEAIGSKRTAGGNQFGMDFYTNSTNRLTITNSGTVAVANNVTVQNGKGIIRSSDGTQQKKLTAVVSINESFNANETKTYNISWPENFSGNPDAFVGCLVAGSTGGWAEVLLTLGVPTSTGVTVYAYNAKSTSVSPNFSYKIVAIGPQ